MVFALALLLALVEAGVVRVAGTQRTEQTELASSQQNTSREEKLEPVRNQGVKVTTLRVTHDKLCGEGQRLGTAYRLKSGEVVYVPEPPLAPMP